MPVDIRGMAPLLQVFDMPTAIRFYRDLLGFEVMSTSRPGDDCDWALLKFKGVEIMLNTAYEREHRPPRRILSAWQRTTILVFTSAARIWRAHISISWLTDSR